VTRESIVVTCPLNVDTWLDNVVVLLSRSLKFVLTSLALAGVLALKVCGTVADSMAGKMAYTAIKIFLITTYLL